MTELLPLLWLLPIFPHLPNAVRYLPACFSLFKGTKLSIRFSPHHRLPHPSLSPIKSTTKKSLMWPLLFYHPFSSRQNGPTGGFWFKKKIPLHLCNSRQMVNPFPGYFFTISLEWGVDSFLSFNVSCLKFR